METAAPPPVDPELARLTEGLEHFAAEDFDSLEAIKKTLSSLPEPSDADLSRDGAFTISTPDPATQVRGTLCLPTRDTTRRPALLYFHGGGLVGGTSRHGLVETLELAEQIGAAVLSVEYGLAPEHQGMDQVEQAWPALEYLRHNAEELAVDPMRIIAVGGSAGGGIAAGLALLDRDRGGAGLAGLMLLSAMLDDRSDTLSSWQLAGQPIWNRRSYLIGWDARLGSSRGKPEVAIYCAPARANDLPELPPTFVDVGSRDTFRDEDVAFANTIWASGGTAELHVWPGAFHGSDVIAPQADLSQDARRAREQWLRRLIDGVSTQHVPDLIPQ